MSDHDVSKLREVRARFEREVREQIRTAAQSGASSQAIADAIGVSRATLWRRYGNEIRRGGADSGALSGGGQARAEPGAGARRPLAENAKAPS